LRTVFSTPVSCADSPFQGHTGHSHRSGRVSSAFLLENCSRYPLFSGYQERFRYVFALGRLLLEKFRMSAKTYEFDYIRVPIEPNQQGIAFYVALQAVLIFT